MISHSAKHTPPTPARAVQAAFESELTKLYGVGVTQRPHYSPTALGNIKFFDHYHMNLGIYFKSMGYDLAEEEEKFAMEKAGFSKPNLYLELAVKGAIVQHEHILRHPDFYGLTDKEIIKMKEHLPVAETFRNALNAEAKQQVDAVTGNGKGLQKFRYSPSSGAQFSL